MCQIYAIPLGYFRKHSKNRYTRKKNDIGMKKYEKYLFKLTIVN